MRGSLGLSLNRLSGRDVLTALPGGVQSSLTVWVTARTRSVNIVWNSGLLSGMAGRLALATAKAWVTPAVSSEAPTLPRKLVLKARSRAASNRPVSLA